MAHDQQTYSRGTSACILGLSIQLLLAIGLLLASFWMDNTGWPAGTVSLYALTWYLFAAVPIWLILLITFNEQRRERVEALEAEALAKSDAAAAQLFDDHADDLALARKRLANVFKWGVPVLAWLVAAFLIIVGIILTLKSYGRLKADGQATMPATVNTAVLMVLTAAAAFIAFTIARYLAGMTKVKEWQLLRGGAGHLMGGALFAILLLVASVFAHLGDTTLFSAMSLVIPVLMIILGVEIVISFMLGFYRPRKPGEVPRTPFDSRLLGWLISPESLGKIVSETLNYQFGFEVSRSWFYQLLSRSVTWLIVFGVGTLLLISCIVIVHPEEEAIITRFGAITGEGENRIKKPGLYLKLPWPVSTKYSYPTGRIHELTVGSVKSKLDHTDSLLWTTAHGPEKEQWLITAPSPAIASDAALRNHDQTSQGMELAGAEIVVQYRVSNLLEFFLSTSNPTGLLTSIVEREVNLYFVSHDLDMLLSRGRTEAGAELEKRIQQRVTEQKLGVTVAYVGFKSIHPPQEAEVAVKFLEQIGALQESQSLIEKARQEATETYASVAGSAERALALNKLIEEANALNGEIDRLRGDPAALKDAIERRAAKELEIVAMIADSPGEAAEQVYAARAERWERVNFERGKALKFLAELAAYNKAKRYYATKIYLDVLVSGMSDRRKYIITSELTGPLRLYLDLTDETDVIGGIIGSQNR